MASYSGSYPHPVLGNRDDVHSEIDIINARSQSDVDFITVEFDLVWTDPDLERLLAGGEARLLVWATCGQTFFSKEVQATELRAVANGSRYLILLDQQDVRGRVNLDFSIIAGTEMTGFSWQNQHEDYGDATFDILPGDVIATVGEIDIDAEKLYDPLAPPLGSCFKVVPDDKLKKKAQVDFFDSEQVVVSVPVDMAPVIQGQAGIVAVTTIVLPALIEAINFIGRSEADGDGGQYDDFLWYTTIKAMVNDRDLDWEKPFEAAQQLLQYPLDEFMGSMEEENDD